MPSFQVYTAETFPHIRVECCDTCQSYIKSIDLTKNGLAEPLIDELASVPTEALGTQEHGYAENFIPTCSGSPIFAGPFPRLCAPCAGCNFCIAIQPCAGKLDQSARKPYKLRNKTAFQPPIPDGAFMRFWKPLLQLLALSLCFAVQSDRITSLSRLLAKSSAPRQCSRTNPVSL